MVNLAEPIVPVASNVGFENFLHGFALVSQVNARKTQLENQIQRMALQNQAMQQRSELQGKEFDLKTQAMNNLADYRSQQVQLGMDKLSRQKQLDDDQRKAEDQFDQRKTEYQHRLFEIPRELYGTDKGQEMFNAAANDFSDIRGEPQVKRIESVFLQSQANAAKANVQAKVNLQKDYSQAIGNVATSYKYKDKVQNYFSNPDVWNLKGGKAYVDVDANGNPIAPDDPQYKAKWKDSFTIDRPMYDSIMQKRQKAFPASPEDTPAIQALPPGMAPGTAPTRVKVVSPDGKQGTIPAEQLQQAIDNGYQKLE